MYTDTFKEEYKGTIYEKFEYQINFGEQNKPIILELHDTGGECFDGEQDIDIEKYINKDIAVICCAMNDRASFELVDKYCNMMYNISPETPRILVMTKMDEEDGQVSF